MLWCECWCDDRDGDGDRHDHESTKSHSPTFLHCMQHILVKKKEKEGIITINLNVSSHIILQLLYILTLLFNYHLSSSQVVSEMQISQRLFLFPAALLKTALLKTEQLDQIALCWIIGVLVCVSSCKARHQSISMCQMYLYSFLM